MSPLYTYRKAPSDPIRLLSVNSALVADPNCCCSPPCVCCQGGPTFMRTFTFNVVGIDEGWYCNSPQQGLFPGNCHKLVGLYLFPFVAGDCVSMGLSDFTCVAKRTISLGFSVCGYSDTEAVCEIHSYSADHPIDKGFIIFTIFGKDNFSGQWVAILDAHFISIYGPAADCSAYQFTKGSLNNYAQISGNIANCTVDMATFNVLLQ